MSALAAGGLITVLGLLFLEPLMRLLGSTDTILSYAKTYAIFILIAAPFLSLIHILIQCEKLRWYEMDPRLISQRCV